MADVNIYTAGKLSGMARSLGLLARSCLDGMEGEKGLTREDALAAMQMSAAMVCGSCSRCNLYSSSEKSDSYYLYYLLRAFEQNGEVGEEDMPRLFLETCRRKEDYLAQLNRNLGRATMNLEWKNRFLESRDTVMVQFRELAVILDEFAHQMEAATDVTAAKEEAVRRKFRLHRIGVENMLLLEYENHQREAYLTVRALGNRCVTAREAAELFSEAVGGSWYAPPDTRTLINRQSASIRFAEAGQYQMRYGTARIPRQGETVCGDNYIWSEQVPGQVILGLSDGMGSGSSAGAESGKIVELLGQLLETGFSARAAMKMANTVLLLTGTQQHPATLDLACVDLHNGVLEAMKMGAVATFVLSDGKVEILEAGELPAGVLPGAEPSLLSRKLWDGDWIVMMTDGVLDACPGVYKEQSMQGFLEEIPVKSPQDLAQRVLDFAVRDGCRDDMTVFVAGIWKKR